jgi:hypothetical protein
MKTPAAQQKLFYFLISIVLLHTTACSTRIQVTEYPTGHESRLAGFSSYCWADNKHRESAIEKIEPAGGHHNVFDPLIRSTINADLKQKSYSETDCATASFIIDYRIGLHEDVVAVDATFDNSPVNPYGPRWSIGDDRSVTYEGLAEPDENIITVRHGTMHVAAFSNTNKILWHSSAEKTLNDKDTEETRKASIKKATQKIMASFPAREK